MLSFTHSCKVSVNNQVNIPFHKAQRTQKDQSNLLARKNWNSISTQIRSYLFCKVKS